MKNSKAEPADPPQNPAAPPRPAELAAAGLSAALLLLLFLYPWDYGPDAWFYRSLADLAHAVIFAIPPLILMPLLRKRLRRRLPQAALITLALCLFAAVLIELLQAFTGREPSFHDAFISLAGSLLTVAAFLFLPLSAPVFSPKNLAALSGTALATGILALTAIPVIQKHRALQWRDTHYPLLADFQDPTQYLLWNPGPDHQPATLQFPPNQPSLRIIPSAAPFAGAKLRLGSQDWSAYSHLILHLHNPHPFPLHLGLRIDDIHGSASLQERYQAPLRLDPGTHSVRIPLADVAATRPSGTPTVDLSAVSQFSIFTDPANPAPQSRADWTLQKLFLEPPARTQT